MYTSVIALIIALFSQSEGEKIILLFPVILSAYIIIILYFKAPLSKYLE